MLPSRVPAEGVLQAEKDFNLPVHPEIEGVPNLQVIKLMQSFKSLEYVTERYSWRHYYWCVAPGRGSQFAMDVPPHGCRHGGGR